MQRAATSVEEQMIVKAIQEEASWEDLPKRLRVFLSSKEEWHRKVKEYCIKKRYKWNDCHARNACREIEYYEELMFYLRKNLALFPYHLSEYVSRILRISPFRYYSDMLFELMKNERPYDSMPNFTAADALRLTGIGRNEFIDIMNKCRTKRLMWKLNKSIIKEMLPTLPIDFPIESWWTVSAVNLSLEEFRKLNEEEMAVIDKICKEEVNIFGLLDPVIVRTLYRRGLLYLDVPVFPEDYFKVSNLQGFVSNREQTYEDPTEELLYAVFVASSEHSTVGELASTLQADPSQLEAAVSLACRLGWAKKVLDPSTVLLHLNMPGSPTSDDNGFDDSMNLSNTPSSSSSSMFFDRALDSQSDAGTDLVKASSTTGRLAFMVDANLTSYLMMGSLSPGLKNHAVTLYEAGKLGDTSVRELCEDLQKVEVTKFEGELQELANHAFSLRHALECLQSAGVTPLSGTESFTDLGDALHLSTSSDSLESAADPFSYQGSAEKENSEVNNDFNPRRSLQSSRESGLPDAPRKSSAQDKDKNQAKKWGFRVEILRCESLGSLPPATLQRLLRRDYNVVVSMVPLPPSSGIPSVIDATGPVHFGPPARAAVSPWIKLMLYSVAGAGPISLALIRGQRLRLLPPPLSDCEKALVWSWDGTSVGGVGGHFDGTLVDGTILLHCLNVLLRSSAVLVQPLWKGDLYHKRDGRPLTRDVPLPFDEKLPSNQVLEEMEPDVKARSELHSALMSAVVDLHLWSIGYISLIRVKQSEGYGDSIQIKEKWVPQSVNLGIPLFDTHLCKMVCERAACSEIFKPGSLQKQREAMQKLRMKLQSFISEYQANGTVSQIVFGRDNLKEPAKLASFVSGKWNPFVETDSDASFPEVNKANNAHPPKGFDRRRRRSEILSFDGDILRSFPLTPVYEANTRLVDDTSTPQSGGTKQDPFDDSNIGEVLLPAVNLLFDGSWLHPLDISPCLQGRVPAALVAEATVALSQQQRQKSLPSSEVGLPQPADSF